MKSYERYSAIRDRLGYSDYRVAKETGIGTATFSNWKKGKYQPKADKISLIASFLGVTPEDITGKKNIIQVFRPTSTDNSPGVDMKDNNDDYAEDRPPEINLIDNPNTILKPSDIIPRTVRFSLKIPVLGRVAAGSPIDAYEEIIDWESVSEDMVKDGEYFALKIKGDSMEPKISNGDVVIVRRQEDAQNGDIVIALVNGDDAVCKRLKKYEDGAVALISTNPAYSPIYFTGKEVDRTPVRILGKVKELRAKF